MMEIVRIADTNIRRLLLEVAYSDSQALALNRSMEYVQK